MKLENFFTLRPAAQADMPAIRALIRETRLNPTGLDWQRFIIAVDAQGGLVGCGQVKPHTDGSQELASIAVTPAWRGKQVARTIIERLLANHPIELYLVCQAEMEAFYQRFGFAVIDTGEMPPYFRRISRLWKTILSLRLASGTLLVMKRPQPPPKDWQADAAPNAPENPLDKVIPVRPATMSRPLLRSPNSDTRPLRERLNDALLRQQMTLYYQPEIDLKSGKVAALEALIRWQDPARGAISLARFIRSLEEDEMIAPLGMWVLDKACRQLTSWQETGQALLPVAINISPRQLANDNFVAETLTVINTYNVPPELIAVEVTEGLLIQDPEGAIQRLGQLRRHGIAVYLDDFGSGYSSLNYLRRLPISHLKIDKAFTDDLDPARSSDPRAASLMKAIIDLAHSLELHVTAEGVENQAQLDMLRGLGCDAVQGFYFSASLPADEIWAAVEKINAAGG